MKKNKIILTALIACFSGMAQAQETAIKMVADGHFFGARQQLEQYIEQAESNDRYITEAEALKLVCDYVLRVPGTADRISSWLKDNPTSPYATPLRSMERIALMRDDRQMEALLLFFESEIDEAGNELPFAYPLSAFSDEAREYNRMLCRLAGEDYYDNGNYQKAIQYFEKGDETRNSLYKLGMSYYNTNDFEKAKTALSKSASTHKDEMAQNAWMHTGLSYLKVNDKKNAQIAFQQASEIEGNAAVREEALYNYAMTLHEGASMGFGESVNVFERFLNDYPSSMHTGKVSKYLSEVYFTTKNYSAALNSINKIKQPNTEILTAKQRVLYNLGIQEFTRGGYDNALNYVNQSIALGQKDAEAHAESYYLKGECEYRQGKYIIAANDLRQAIELGKKTPAKSLKNQDYATYSLAYSMFKQKNYDAAMPIFDEVVKSPLAQSNPRLAADAYNRLGDCYLNNRNYDMAYEFYEKAHEAHKGSGDYSLLQQAYIQGLRGDYDAKVAIIEKMKSEFAESEYSSDALFEQGRAYVQKGNNEEATKTFQAIIQQYPLSTNARKAGNEIAMLLAEAGSTEDAIAAYKQVINNYPNTEEAQTALANLKDIYTSQGRVNEYLSMANNMGKTFTNEELDEMMHDAAVKAMASGDYEKAQKYYGQLRAQTASDDYRLEAQVGVLRSAYSNKDYATTIAIATEIQDDANKLSPEIKAEAMSYRADCYIKQNDSDRAVADWQALSQDSQTVYGAQATVSLAQYAYDTKQYESAETIISKFIESGTPHAYWLARAFVLLSDLYKAQNREVEARQTLLSLQSNYSESEEINAMIEERLGKMTQP